MGAGKSLGYLLIVASFLGGAFLAVREVEAVAVGPFLAALAMGALGVAMVRVALHREAHHEDRVAANVEAIEGSLTRLVEKVDRLDDEKASIDVYDLRRRIDDELPEELASFVEARESIAHSFGLAAYAEVMNSFAAGERYVNRVWSCSTDGYQDEAHTYLSKAREQFREALKSFQALR